MKPRQTVFALVREGSSDDGLLPHLQELLLRNGLPEVIGESRSYTGSTLARLEELAREESVVDLVFVQRDADARSPAGRRREIKEAAARTSLTVVPVVPVQELEAWLLTDEAAIRTVAGKPNGRAKLELPALGTIEAVNSPKEKLRQALIDASETTGRRRERFRKSFSTLRRELLQRLDIDGSVRELPSWRAMEDDIAAAAARLLDADVGPDVLDQA